MISMGQKVSVKGVDDKLVITLQETNWVEGNNVLRGYVNDNKRFLENAKIVLDVKDIVVRSNDLFDLRNFLNDNKISLTTILSSQEETNTSANLLGITNRSTEKTKPIPHKHINPTQKTASIIKKTIRSGVLIEDPNDIVIIGEVNPGAVIISDGNIIVWGKLLGEVHAGRSGEKTAMIAALEMNPSLMTIAEVQFENIKRKCKEPEIAYLQHNVIRIDSWKKISY
jgi:septum site-determining protein MinC